MYSMDCFPKLKQRIHKEDPVEVSNQYLFGSNFRSQDTTHALTTLLESQSCTRVKIILSLTNPTQARDLLENYTTGYIPYDNKDVEIYLIVEKGYGDVCFLMITFPSYLKLKNRFHLVFRNLTPLKKTIQC